MACMFFTSSLHHTNPTIKSTYLNIHTAVDLSHPEIRLLHDAAGETEKCISTLNTKQRLSNK